MSIEKCFTREPETLYARTRLVIYRRNNEGDLRPLGPFYNNLSSAAISEMLRLMAGTSTRHLDARNVHLKLLDEQGGSKVGVGWLSQASSGPGPGRVVKPNPTFSVSWIFDDDSTTPHLLGAAELWQGPASGTAAQDYNLDRDGYLFAEIDTGSAIPKAADEQREYEVTFELYADGNFTNAACQDVLECITDENAVHFDQSHVLLRPMSDGNTEIAGADLAAQGNPVIDFDDNEISWLFVSEAGRFSEEWTHTRIKHERADSTIATFRTGGCRSDGTPCGTKDNTDEWRYRYAIRFARGSGDLPDIRSFNATPDQINKGQSTTLRWLVLGATEIEIDQNIGTVAGDSTVVTPDATTTYTLTARNSHGSVRRTVNVRVVGKPIIHSFTVNPTTVRVGEAATLAWNVADATDIRIDQGVGVVTASGRHTVAPTQTTVYTLTATNSAGSVTERVTLTVERSEKPIINSFTAMPRRISAGSSSTLAWNVSGATALSIRASTGPSPGNVLNRGLVANVGVNPKVTTTYRLVATNDAGSVGRSVTVTVRSSAAPPRIISFTPKTATIVTGDSVLQKWRTQDATRVELTVPDGDTASSLTTRRLSGRTYDVTNSSSFPAAPTTLGNNVYTLTAYNEDGVSVSATATITVVSRIDRPQIVEFEANPSRIARGRASTLSWDVVNADEVSIDHGIGTVKLKGTMAVRPTSTTTYTITAIKTGQGGQVRDADATATVTVSDDAVPPDLARFTATPANIDQGDFTRLAWDATGHTAGQITSSNPDVPNPGAVTARQRHLDVAPAASTTYTLTVVNEAGEDSAKARVTVNVVRPEIVNFSGPRYVSRGSDVRLQWIVLNADEMWLTANRSNVLPSGVDTPGGLSGDDITIKSLQNTTIFTLHARLNGQNEVTETWEVGVGLAPTIIALRAGKDPVDANESTTVEWTVQGSYNRVTLKQGSAAAEEVTATLQGGSMFNEDVTPTAPATEYIVTVEHDFGADVTEKITISVGGPKITRFDAAPPSLTLTDDRSGVTGSSTITWTTENADQVLLNGTPVAANGSQQVAPTSTTKYTLVARAAGFPEQTKRADGSPAVVTIQVNPPMPPPPPPPLAMPPRIVSFVANPPILTLNSAGTAPTRPSTLTWDTENATTVELDGAAVALDGTMEVAPTSDTNYTLVAKRDGHADVTRTIQVKIGPSIHSFSGPDAIAKGNTARLNWITTAADEIWITADRAGVLPAGVSTPGTLTASHLDVENMQRTTTFTLHARSGAGTEVTRTHKVAVGVPPKIAALRTAQPSIAPGESTTLEWGITGEYDTVSVTQDIGDDIGEVSPYLQGGSLFSEEVSPTETTEYTVTVTHGFGAPVTDSVSLIVSPNPPTIDSFVADPPGLMLTEDGQGTTESATLAWATSNADTVLLNGAAVLTSGTQKVAPLATTTYTLTVRAVGFPDQELELTIQVEEYSDGQSDPEGSQGGEGGGSEGGGSGTGGGGSGPGGGTNGDGGTNGGPQ